MKKNILSKLIYTAIISSVILSASIPVFASYTYQENGQTQYYTDKKFTDKEQFTDGGLTFAILDDNEVAITGYDSNNVSFDIDLTNVNYSGTEYSVTYISPDAFKNNKGIKTIKLENLLAIGNNAFEGCTNLEEVDFPSVKTIGDEVFKDATNLKTLNVASTTNLGSKVFVNCSSLVNLYLQGLTEKKNLSESDFDGCSSLVKIVINNETLSYNSLTTTTTTETTTETTTQSKDKETTTKKNETENNMSANYITKNNYLKNPANPISFSDVPKDHWAIKEIEILASYGIFNGTGNGLFNPNGNTTRADFIIALTNILGIEGTATTSFTDVLPNTYYANRIALAEKSGILPASPNNKFNPTVPITREDAMIIIANACLKSGVKLNTNNSILSNFSDSQNISEDAKESISMLINQGIITGNDKGQLEPKKLITRAELSKLMGSVFNLLIPEPSKVNK